MNKNEMEMNMLSNSGSDFIHFQLPFLPAADVADEVKAGLYLVSNIISSISEGAALTLLLSLPVS